MTLVKTSVALLAVFAVGVVVGALKSRIVRALRIRLGLPERTLGYQARLEFVRQTVGDADVVMLGDSITEGVGWHELFPNVRLLNAGLSPTPAREF